jgi:hypothetical protein
MLEMATHTRTHTHTHTSLSLSRSLAHPYAHFRHPPTCTQLCTHSLFTCACLHRGGGACRMSGGHCKHMKIVHVDGGVTLSGATDGMARPTLALLLEHYATLTLSDDVGVLLDVAGNGGAAATAAKRRVSARPAPAPPGSTNGTSQTRTAPPPPEADYGTDTGHPPVASSQVSTARTASSARIPARAAPLPPPPAAGPAAEALNLDAMEVDVPSEPTVGPPPIAHTSPKVAATTDDDELPDPTCEADFEVPPLLPEQVRLCS